MHTYKLFNAEKKINETFRGKQHVFTGMLYNEPVLFPLFFLTPLRCCCLYHFYLVGCRLFTCVYHSTLPPPRCLVLKLHHKALTLPPSFVVVVTVF